MNWRIFFTILCLTLVPDMHAQGLPGINIDGPFVRVKRNDDGSKTVFERGKNKKTLTKKTMTPKGHVTLSGVYRLDEAGNPLKCDIFDGLGNRLYKTSFGYSKRLGPTYGKLVHELLFDTRVKRYYEKRRPDGSRMEKPVHMFIYSYNADGSANLPVGISLIKGKTAEEIFGKRIEPQVLPNMDELEPGEATQPNPKPLPR